MSIYGEVKSLLYKDLHLQFKYSIFDLYVYVCYDKVKKGYFIQFAINLRTCVGKEVCIEEICKYLSDKYGLNNAKVDKEDNYGYTVVTYSELAEDIFWQILTIYKLSK